MGLLCSSKVLRRSESVALDRRRTLLHPARPIKLSRNCNRNTPLSWLHRRKHVHNLLPSHASSLPKTRLWSSHGRRCCHTSCRKSTSRMLRSALLVTQTTIQQPSLFHRSSGITSQALWCSTGKSKKRTSTRSSSSNLESSMNFCSTV